MGAESPTRPVQAGGAGAGAGTVTPAAASTVTSQPLHAAQSVAVDSSRPVTSPRERPTTEGQQQAGEHLLTISCHTDFEWECWVSAARCTGTNRHAVTDTAQCAMYYC